MLRWWPKILRPKHSDIPEVAPPNSNYNPESKYVVICTDTHVECRYPDASVRAVNWVDIKLVLIDTNDTGPIGIDVWFVLFGSDPARPCMIPQGATREAALLDQLFKLPNFDFEQHMAAMACTANQRFVCWKSPSLQL